MKNDMKNLINEFIDSCKEIQEERYSRKAVTPTFENFIAWLNDRTWDME